MSEFPMHVRAATREYTDTLLKLPNVVGVGAAMRRRGGKVTDEPIVVTYVSRKFHPTRCVITSAYLSELRRRWVGRYRCC